MLERTIGTTVQVRGTFKNLATPAAKFDPTVVILTIKAPDGTTASYTYGVGVTVVRDEEGVYHAWVLGDQIGVWIYQFEGSGTDYVVVDDDEFRIRPRKMS